MVDAGLDDILISYPLIGSAKALRLAELAGRARFRVACDSTTAIDTVGEAALAAKAPTRHWRWPSMSRKTQTCALTD